MSATVNGSAISFTSSFTNSNGYTIMTGTSSTYSIQLYLKLTGGGGTFTLSDPSTNNYATVSNSFATYTTSSGSPGYAYVTQGSNGLYNGTFYFSATNGQTVSVSNGSFSNM
jgi:hypothetical protein